MTAHHVEKLDPLRFQSPRTSSRSRDREVALTVPHVHSATERCFSRRNPKCLDPDVYACACVCVSLGVYARACGHADVRTNVFKTISY